MSVSPTLAPASSSAGDTFSSQVSQYVSNTVSQAATSGYFQTEMVAQAQVVAEENHALTYTGPGSPPPLSQSDKDAISTGIMSNVVVAKVPVSANVYAPSNAPTAAPLVTVDDKETSSIEMIIIIIGFSVWFCCAGMMYVYKQRSNSEVSVNDVAVVGGANYKSVNFIWRPRGDKGQRCGQKHLFPTFAGSSKTNISAAK